MVGQTGNSSARYLKTLASTAKRDTLHRAASKLNLNPVEEISSPDEEESEVGLRVDDLCVKCLRSACHTEPTHAGALLDAQHRSDQHLKCL